MIIQGVTLNSVRVVDATFNTSNLILHLDANQVASYSGSGTTVNDISGNNHTHTLTGAAYTMLNGVKCFDCTTGTGRVVVNSTGPTLPTSGFTYTTWARLQPGNSSSFRTLLYTNSPRYTPITIPNNSNTLGYWDTAFRSSGYDLASAVDTWVQYAVVGDNSSQTFYINGVQAGNSIAQGPGGTTHWGWGNNDTVAGQPWGHVANLQLYNTKLTAEKIQQNYYNQLSTFTLSNIVTSNLVLWYDPSVSASYSGSGSTINNLASTSLSGTMSNITHTSPYFSYNGTNSQVSITDNSLLEPGSGDWTMEVWVNQSVATGSQVILGKFDPGGGSQDVSYAIRVSSGNVRADFGNGSTAMNTSNYALSIGTWTQLVYVFNNVANNNIITYVNGVQQATTTHSFASILNTSANFTLGSYNGGEYPQYFNGRIGITRLYSAALSSADVLQNYNADKSKYGL